MRGERLFLLRLIGMKSIYSIFSENIGLNSIVCCSKYHKFTFKFISIRKNH